MLLFLPLLQMGRLRPTTGLWSRSHNGSPRIGSQSGAGLQALSYASCCPFVYGTRNADSDGASQQGKRGLRGKDVIDHHEAGNKWVRSGPQKEQQEMSGNWNPKLEPLTYQTSLSFL